MTSGGSPDPGASVWPLVGKWAMNINTDSGWGRITEPDITLSYSLDPWHWLEEQTSQKGLAPVAA